MQARRRGARRAASTSPARRARTTSRSTRTTRGSSGWSRSARRRCARARTSTTSGARVLDGLVDLVASDHSPSPPELKQGDDAFAAWGGIAGCQTLLRVLLTEGPPRGLSLESIATLSAAAPARRFRLAGKGSLDPGADADLALVDLDAEAVLTAGELLSRHPLSPFVGRELRGRVVRTIVRGSTVCLEGDMVAPPAGRLVRPHPDADGGEVVGANVTGPAEGPSRKENRV